MNIDLTQEEINFLMSTLTDGADPSMVADYYKDALVEEEEIGNTFYGIPIGQDEDENKSIIYDFVVALRDKISVHATE